MKAMATPETNRQASQEETTRKSRGKSRGGRGGVVGEAIIIKRILLWRFDIVLRIINEIAYTLI